MSKTLRVSVKTFRKYVKDFELPFYGSTRDMRFVESEVLDALRQTGKTVENETSLTVKPPHLATRNKYTELLGL